jgi:hypothetical protein
VSYRTDDFQEVMLNDSASAAMLRQAFNSDIMTQFFNQCSNTQLQGLSSSYTKGDIDERTIDDRTATPRIAHPTSAVGIQHPRSTASIRDSGH